MARPSKNSKPMSNAERQRMYRFRKKLDLIDKERRLNTMISLDAMQSLERLVRWDSQAGEVRVTKKQMLETLLRQAEQDLVKKLDKSQIPEYFADEDFKLS